MYAIRCLPRRFDITMGAHGFQIDLAPAFREQCGQARLDQGMIDTLIQSCGRGWLDSAGFDRMYDPDSPGYHEDGKPRKLGPNARKMYQERDIRVDWGDWGPRHISVPGNACGLDINHGFGNLFERPEVPAVNRVHRDRRIGSDQELEMTKRKPDSGQRLMFADDTCTAGSAGGRMVDLGPSACLPRAEGELSSIAAPPAPAAVHAGATAAGGRIYGKRWKSSGSFFARRFFR